ncbi:hypothetical protein AN219_32020 [Streptomyces nanshensis]|nr:hypothetical protein AN219_32020 [Streptomyces nanshensis]
MTASRSGAITQNPGAIGRQVVRASVAAIKRKRLPEVIETGHYWYDRRNIDDPRIRSVPYR